MTEPPEHDNRLHALLRLRVLVAFLGERPQYNWWSSMFLGSTAASVLAHPFPRTAHLAQYHGAVEAARKTHDDLIGIGQVLHPFRASDEVEQDLHALVIQNGPNAFSSIAPGKDSVLSQLTALGSVPPTPMVGPALVGQPSELLTPEAMRKVAGIYAAAFASGQRAYPYFKAL